MGTNLYVPPVKTGDWESVKRAIRILSSPRVLGPDATPTFAGLTLTGLTASRLIQTDANKVLASVTNLTSWIAGVANEIDISDNGDGTVTIGIVDPLIVGKGGIGTASLTDHGILLGSGTSAVTPLGVAANGQIPIGSAGADPVLAEITGTANQITSTPGAGTITLSLPQDIHTGASPTFVDLTLTGANIINTSGTVNIKPNDETDYFEISRTVGKVRLKGAGGANTDFQLDAICNLQLLPPGDILIQPSGDIADYYKFHTVSNVPILESVGGCDSKYVASSGVHNFDGDVIWTTDGSAAAPAFALGASKDYGMYTATGFSLGLSTQGVQRLGLNATQAVFSVPIDVQSKFNISADTSGTFDRLLLVPTSANQKANVVIRPSGTDTISYLTLRNANDLSNWGGLLLNVSGATAQMFVASAGTGTDVTKLQIGETTQSDLTNIEFIFNNVIKADLDSSGNLQLDGNLDVDSSGSTIAGITQIGGASDFSKFEVDGTLEFNGAATVWKDTNMGAGTLSGPPGLQPGIVNFVDEVGADTGIATYGLAVGEGLSGFFEIQHDYKEGSDITFHVHWQGIAAPTGTDKVQFQLTYTIASEKTSETLDAVTVITVESNFNTQYESLLTSFTAITGTNIEIGDQFLFTIERIAASADEYGGEALLQTIGIHYEINTVGSRAITTK